MATSVALNAPNSLPFFSLREHYNQKTKSYKPFVFAFFSDQEKRTFPDFFSA
jgi:hypothetical protein